MGATPMNLIPILLFQGGHNTSTVMLGAAALGAAGGVVGVFALLRKRALLAEAVAHATLPGIALGFIAAYLLGFSTRAMPFLMAGALLTAALAVTSITFITRTTRLRPDTAVATILGVYFGLGVALMSVVQGLDTAGQAGLDTYLLGSTAGIGQRDALILCGLAVLVAVLAALSLKELRVTAFDPVFAQTSGLHPDRINIFLVALILLVIVLGLRTVGLVLGVALLVIPPAAARFWTNRLIPLVLVSAGIGAAGAWIGAALSASMANLPAGATIVLCLFGLFTVSFATGTHNGLLGRRWHIRHS
jgi:manganese/zinc/iron transport system permease protein